MNVLIAVIKAYYPTKKILDNEIELEVWREEFEKFDNKITLEATKNVCRNNEDGLDVNIAVIRNEYYRLKNQKENIKKITNTDKDEKASPEFISKLIKEHF